MSMMTTLTRIAHDWAVRAFGKSHVVNLAVRGLRHLEESAELSQALNVPEETAIACIRMVYAKPVGEALQELGGSLLTAAVICQELGVTPEDMLEREVRRVLNKPPKFYTDRNQAKIDQGMTVEEGAGAATDPRPYGGVANPQTPTKHAQCPQCDVFKLPMHGGWDYECTMKCGQGGRR